MSQFVITLDNKDSKLKCYHSLTVRLVFGVTFGLFCIPSLPLFFEIYLLDAFSTKIEMKKKTFKTIRKSFNENNFLLGKPDDDAFVVVAVCRLIDLRIEDLLMKSHDECLFLMRSRK